MPSRNDTVLILLEEIRDRIEKIELVLTGNGDPEKGVIVRLDRAERFVKILMWCFGATLTAVATAAATAFFS